jgi:hypothetical protein
MVIPSVGRLYQDAFRKPHLRRFGCREGLRSARAFHRRSLTAARVAADTGDVHTPSMTLKNAALLALIGTILMTALLVWTFVFNFLNLMRGLVPAVTLFSSFIYAFGCFSVAVFFFVFHRTQR